MECRDIKEPLEAEEDGTFDLGDPSPPPSPVRPLARATPEARSNTSSEIEDDWEEVNVQKGEGEVLDSPGDASEGFEEASEGFEDAVELLRPGEHVGQSDEIGNAEPAEGETGTVPGQAAVEKPAPACPGGRRSSMIAAGLSSIRLPMVQKRLLSGGHTQAVEKYGDSDDEFHDALENDPLPKRSASKAMEMKEKGNEYYKSGDFEDATDYYTMALQYCPLDEANNDFRAILLANRAQAHLRLEEYSEVVEDCTAALELHPGHVKALLRRAQANEQLEKYDVALEDAKKLLEIDPNLRVAKDSVTRLEKLQKEKNEQMKDEAIGKLKELGNSVLGNFGLSLDNFKMQQDPNTGSYSINFEK